jgi:hypothetical protein
MELEAHRRSLMKAGKNQCFFAFLAFNHALSKKGKKLYMRKWLRWFRLKFGKILEIFN